MRRHNAAPPIALVRHTRYPFHSHVRRDALALRDAGFDVDVICDHEPGRPYYERCEGITVLRMPLHHKRGGMLRYLFEYAAFPLLAGGTIVMRSLWRRYRYIEVDTPPDWLIAAALIPRALGARVILYMFDNLPELTALDYGLSADHLLARPLVAIERVCAAFADCLIVPHEMARRILIQHKIVPEKIVVVPNGPDERLFLADVRDSEPGMGNAAAPVVHYASPEGPSGLRLVTHGTLLERYGIQTLLEAMALLRGRLPGLHLQIIGEGEYRPALQALASRLELDERVAFRGFVAFEHIAPLLLMADVAVVPMWTPFVPNKLMEYLALGLPVIITDWPAVRLYFDDSAVCYVEPKNARALAEAIMALYGDPARRAALASRGHAVYRERYAWERIKHTYLAVYGVTPRAPTCARAAAPHDLRRAIEGAH
jgi:glycosyltransferase involved in cell wall biosynthesis